MREGIKPRNTNNNLEVSMNLIIYPNVNHISDRWGSKPTKQGHKTLEQEEEFVEPKVTYLCCVVSVHCNKDSENVCWCLKN